MNDQLELAHRPRESERQSLIRLMVEKGATADQLAIVLDTQLKFEANEARKAFILALEQFKTNLPVIYKTKLVAFKDTHYKHAELDKICDIIVPALLRVGITHSWRPAEKDGRISVTCVFRHSLGHEQDMSTLSGPADTSGGKNSIQAIGSTNSYLERYSLLAACGIAAKGEDDDASIEHMDENAVLDYISAIQDSSDLAALQGIFAECKEKAKAIKDNAALKRFIVAKDEKKKQLGVRQ